MEEKKKSGKGKLFVLVLSFLIIGICIGGVLCCFCYKKYGANKCVPEESESSAPEKEVFPEVYSSFDGESHLVIEGNKFKLNYLDATNAKALEGDLTKDADVSIEKRDNTALIKNLFEDGPNGGMEDLVLFNVNNMTGIKEKLGEGAEKYLGEYFDGNDHAKATGYNLRNIYRCNHTSDAEDMVCIMEYFIEFENYTSKDCLGNEKYAKDMMPACEDGGVSNSYAIRYNYKTLEALELASLND